METSPLFPYQTTPEETEGKSTSTTYVVVDDIDVHYEKAKAAGAEIVLDIHNQPPGRYYFCKDVEGILWSFGTYDPYHRIQQKSWRLTCDKQSLQNIIEALSTE